MADLDLYCNFKKCRKRLTQFAWVTRCSHVFCEEDGTKELVQYSGNDIIQRKCPACGMQLQKSFDVVKVDLDPPEEFKSMVLAGLRPEITADIINRSLTFWNYQIYQQQLHQQSAIKQARDSIAEVEKYYESVVHKITTSLQHKEQKLKESQEQIQAQEQLIAELKEQLTVKIRQAHKAQHLYESLRRNNTSTSIMDNKEEQKSSKHTVSHPFQHRCRHQESLPPKFPFIHPQRIPSSLPCSAHKHSRDGENLNQHEKEFEFNPMTPAHNSSLSGTSFSKKPRTSHNHIQRPPHH